MNPQNGNFAKPTWLTWVPALMGATDNPAPTYTSRSGRYQIVGGLVFFKFALVTSTMTKTTLTDALEVLLPFPSANNAAETTVFGAKVQNATAVTTAVRGIIAANSNVCTFENYATASDAAVLTYATASPGIGVLTNSVTLIGSGFYEFQYD